jgi:ElaB/YqjD/DUF883 family membrane-anchored ribosome-binding protein
MGEATDKMNIANWNEDRITSTQDDDSYLASESTDYENPEQIRAEIEDTRAEMSQTINEIQERLSPENVMEQVKEKVREATVGKVEKVMDRVGETIGEVTEPAREVVGRAGTAIKETGKSAADVIWRNPIPVALIGLGLGMLVMRAVRGGNGYDYDDTPRNTSRQSLMGGETGYERGEIGYERGQTQYPTTGTLNQVKETASGLAHRSTEALNNLSTKAKDTASSIGTRFEQVLRENPLAVGAVAVAAGTAVGLVLPATKFETEYIGETSERLVDKAQEVAREAIDKVQSAAQQQMASEPQPRA